MNENKKSTQKIVGLTEKVYKQIPIVMFSEDFM